MTCTPESKLDGMLASSMVQNKLCIVTSVCLHTTLTHFSAKRPECIGWSVLLSLVAGSHTVSVMEL